MRSKVLSVALGLSLLAAGSAQAEILKAVMAIKGAEMSWWGGMAADAVARQYDVDKNRVTLICETDKGSYRPGTITFFPKKGKTIDLRRIEDSLRATRLSGGTSMSVDYLDITAYGEVIVGDKTIRLKLSGTSQPFVLKHAKDKNDALERLREAAAAGGKMMSVSGRVDGWSGRFPAVLSALGKRSPDEPIVLFVTDFETNKKWPAGNVLGPRARAPLGGFARQTVCWSSRPREPVERWCRRNPWDISRNAHEGRAAECVWRCGGRGRSRSGSGAHLNHGGHPGPARVSRKRHGRTGGELADAGADRGQRAAAGPLLLHPVRAQARHPGHGCRHLAGGAVCSRLLDLAHRREWALRVTVNILRFFACLLPVALCGLVPKRAVEAVQQPGDDKVITNSIGMKLTLIPAGKFLMGSPAAEPERDDEELQHEVVLGKPFYMGVHEVTQAQFDRVMGKHNSHFNEKNGGGPDHPVENVPWNVAANFCVRLSALPAEKQAGRVYRLPTEAEWEYACRAGSTTAFHFGNALSSTQANFNGNYPEGKAAKGPYLKRTTKVGSYQPNAWGLYDTHGNVAEWCSDWYDPEYYKKSPKQDPTGPADGVVPTGFAKDYYHVVRGGCWHDEGRACRAAYRFRLQSTEQYRLVGLRVVCVVGK